MDSQYLDSSKRFWGGSQHRTPSAGDRWNSTAFSFQNAARGPPAWVLTCTRAGCETGYTRSGLAFLLALPSKFLSDPSSARRADSGKFKLYLPALPRPSKTFEKLKIKKKIEILDGECVKRRFSPQTVAEDNLICPREGAMRTTCKDHPTDSQKRMWHQK